MTSRRLPPAVLVCVAMIGVLLSACGDDKSSNPTDPTPPAAITNLEASSPTNSSITLNWTAPGDDGSAGTATEYDMRYFTQAITASNWAAAVQAVGEPAPHVSGTQESFTVVGLSCNTTYYFVMRTRDEVAANWSGLSDGSSDRTQTCESGGGNQMLLLSSATFMMGSPASELGFDPGEVQHQVTLTRPFYLSEHEVTQREWSSITLWSEPSFPGPGGQQRPVEQVTWYDAVDFCNRNSIADGFAPAYTISDPQMDGNHILSAMVAWNEAANGYRLPTEAEWEYGCRAGTQTAFASGDITTARCSPLDPNLDLIGWYCGNAGGKTHLVGQKQANAFGLKDMHGNVFEWCWDWYESYPSAPVTDPRGASQPDPENPYRIMRGGSWFNYGNGPVDCRSACRWALEPTNRYNYVGLRLARSAR